MEVLVIIALIIFLFVLLNFKRETHYSISKIQKQQEDIQTMLFDLQARMSRILQNTANIQQQKSKEQPNYEVADHKRWQPQTTQKHEVAPEISVPLTPEKEPLELQTETKETVLDPVVTETIAEPIATETTVTETIETKQTTEKEPPTTETKETKETKEPQQKTPQQTDIPLYDPSRNRQQRPTQKQTPKPSGIAAFIKRNFDSKTMEEFIGGNLLNKIGIIVTVLGLGFLVKYAIDKNWIGPVYRVAVGILAGGILIGIAHRLRKSYQAFSSVLVGGGLATLYFTIALAFHSYSLFSPSVAFVIMVIITIFAVLLALGYNRIELAILAILGGFASPILVRTGNGHYEILFTYIIILNSGMLILAYFKKWNLVNIVAYVCTVILFGGWFAGTHGTAKAVPYIGALSFATAFYIIFFLMNIINTLRTKATMRPIEISILLSNTFLYYLVGMLCIDGINPTYQGVFTVLLAVFNFAFAFNLYRNAQIDRRLVYLLIGLVLTFISLTAPVQLKGNHITLFWAAESVLLLWLYMKSDIKLVKYAMLAIQVLMVLSLWADFEQVYMHSSDTPLPILLNRGFITGVVASVALVAVHWLLKQVNEKTMFASISSAMYRDAVLVLTLGTIYATGAFELSTQTRASFDFNESTQVYMAGYYYVFVLAVLLLATATSRKWLAATAVVGAVLGIFAYFSVFQPFIFVDLRDLYLQNKINFSHFAFHYFDVAILAILIVFVYKALVKLFEQQNAMKQLVIWMSAFCAIFILSAELDHLVMLATFDMPPVVVEDMADYDWMLLEVFDVEKDRVLSQSHRIGYPILWSILSFVAMLMGLQRKKLQLRIIALTVFFITLLKLFTFDVWEMSEGGKIVAFVLLGVFLLIISFLYQKLKELLFENIEKEDDTSI